MPEDTTISAVEFLKRRRSGPATAEDFLSARRGGAAAIEDPPQPVHVPTIEQLPGVVDQVIATQRTADQDAYSRRLTDEIRAERRGETKVIPDWVSYTLDRIPFTGAVNEANRMAITLDAAKRLASGRGRGNDFAMVADLLVQLEKKEEQGWAGDAIDIMTQLPGFATEFAATGGAFTAGKKATKAALMKVLKTQIQNKAVNALSAVGGVALQTAANPQLVARNVSYNLAEDLHLEQDDAGRLQVQFEQDDGTFLPALGRALVQSGVELGTERLGFLVEKPLVALKGAVMRRWARRQVENGVSGKGLVDRFNQALKAGGWNGILGEVFEERAAEALSFLHGDAYEPPTARQLAAEATAFSVPMLASSAAAQVQKRAARKVGIDKMREALAALEAEEESAPQPAPEPGTPAVVPAEASDTQDVAPPAAGAVSAGSESHPVLLSWEAQPGWNTGYLRGLHQADYRTRLAFMREVRQAFLDPETGRDIIGEELGWTPQPRGEGDIAPSAFVNSAGRVEVNPAEQITGQLPVPGGAVRLDPQERKRAEAYAMLQGLYSFQEAVAGVRPFHSILPDEQNLIRVGLPQPLSEEQMASLVEGLNEQFGPGRVAAVPGANRLLVLNTTGFPGENLQEEGATWRQSNLDFQGKILDVLDRWADGANIQELRLARTSADGIYEENDWQQNPQGENYRRGIDSRVGSDVLARLDLRLAPRVASVYQQWSQRGFGQAPVQQGPIATRPERQNALPPSSESGPPPTTPAGQSPTRPESERKQKAKQRLRDAWGDMLILGAAHDPRRDARKAWEFYKAAADLARIYIAEGVRDVSQFARDLGLEVTELLRRAWADALGGRIASSPEELGSDFAVDQAVRYRERRFSRRLAEDDSLTTEVREAAGNREYLPTSNEVDAAQAMAIVEREGIVGALALIKDERNGLTESVRVILGEALIRKANQAYAQTRDQRALDAAVDAAEWLTEYGTRLGQGVQAFAVWSRMTPAGYVRSYQRAVNQSRRRQVERAGGEERAKARKLKLPKYDPAIAGKVLVLAERALRLPEGFQRDEAIIDVLALIARQQGISKWDIATGLWYANLLSGWTTQARNIMGTLSHVLSEFWAHGAARPGAIPSMLAGLYTGIIRGGRDAINVLKTGKITGTRIKKLEVPMALELVRWKGPAYPLHAWKYVFRVMAAADMTFFRSAQEMKSRFLARTLAREEGRRGADLNRRMAEILHNTPAVRRAAEDQARTEGLSGLNFRRRVDELMEQARPAALVKQAADYGRFATYNQEPDGVMGVLARGISNMSRQYRPLRLLVPFTQVVANVTNNALNYTPWGYSRLFNAGNINEERAPSWGSEEFRIQAARATLGTLGLSALFGLALAGGDDEDPPFAITASGPSDAAKRFQLQESGWRPYSVKVGDAYLNYQWSNMHLGLALLGNLLDASRWRKLDEADAWNRAYYVMMRVPNTILSQSFLKGLADFFGSVSRDNVPKTRNQFGGLARTVSSFAVPNLAKQIDRMFDPTVYDASTVQGAIVRDVPIARQGQQPMINVLGEPIQYDLNPFLKWSGRDRLWSVLAGKSAFISVPDKLTMVGDRTLTPAEYYGYVKTSGRAIRQRLELYLPVLESVDSETAQDLVGKVVREERTRAKRMLFGVRR